jgi:hypothetical protein
MQEPRMPQWLQSMVAGWPMIAANVPTFIALVVIIFGAVWGAMYLMYGAVISNKDSEISLLKSQRDDYRDKLGGASPAQAKERMETLEQTIGLTIGTKWTPLTDNQISDLATKLSAVPKSRATIMYENALGKDLARTFFEAFKAAGWTEVQLTTGSGLGEGVVTGWSTRAASIKALINTTRPDIPVWVKDQEKEIPDLIILGVGIKIQK